MCKKNVYAKMEKLEAQVGLCRCTRQGLKDMLPQSLARRVFNEIITLLLHQSQKYQKQYLPLLGHRSPSK